MKKAYKIQVDCAVCAGKMQDAASKIDGINKVTVNYMTGRMVVDFKDGASPDEVMKTVCKACKKIEPECSIELGKSN